MSKTALVFKSLALFALTGAQAYAETLFEATYKGRHSGVNIELVRALEQDSENQYRLHSKASNFLGYIMEQSRFQLIGNQVQADQYVYERKVFGRKSHQELNFDWTQSLVRYTRTDKPEKNAEFTLEQPDVLDPSLYQLKLQQELSQGAEQFRFTFAKDSRVKDMDFTVTGQTEYEMGDETYNAVIVERINQPDDRETEILLVPELNYQIARIVHTEEDGSSYTIRLAAYKGKKDALQRFYTRIGLPNANQEPASASPM